MSEHVVSDFKGKDGLLIQSIDSLLEMDAKGILVPHGIGGHARTLLRAAKAAIEQAALTKQAETHAIELRAYEATVQNLEQRIKDLQLEKELGEALMEQAVAVIGEPVAILRRQIGEDTWFDWTPVLPNSKTHKQLKAAGEMDYCEVYQRYTQSIPASKLAALREKAESVSEGWKGWRDVYVHGYPEAAQEVLFARGGITVHGAFIGGIFWHSNEKCAAALWMPLPTPLTPDEHRAMLAAAQEGGK